MVSIFHTLARTFLYDPLLLGLLATGLVLSIVHPQYLFDYPSWVEWSYIQTLVGLMVLTKGIEESGYPEHLGRQLISRITNERSLALFLIAAAAMLSTVLSNDIAIFIVVPLTLGLRGQATLPLSRLVIFEVLAVNAGSMLTPVGNPQNILLWQLSGLSFGAFSLQMAPLALVLLAVLLAISLQVFPQKQICVVPTSKAPLLRPRLFWGCLALYVPFLLAVDLGHPVAGMLGVMLCAAINFRQTLCNLDWGLIAVFVLMFVDTCLLTKLFFLSQLLEGLGHYSASGLLLSGILGSQLMSSFPITILLTHYVPASKAIMYAVNIGGFGLVLGSLANLIAMRMVREQGVWREFHFYSVPLLLVASFFGYLLV